MAHLIRISLHPRYHPGIKYAREEEARYRKMKEEAKERSGQRFRSLLSGIRVDASLAPRTAQATDHQDLYDFVTTHLGWLLSRRAMDLIESIDHGVHQFIPFDLRLADGSPAPEPRWLFNNCAQLDTAIAQEHSTVGPLMPHNPDWFFDFDPGPKKLAVYAEKVAHRAIWSDRRFKEVFVSDLFWNELQRLAIHEIESALPVTEV